MRVLVVEDDHVLRRTMARRLRRDGVDVDEAASLADADAHSPMDGYDCLVLDRMLPDGDAIDLLSRLRAQGADVPALMVTARADVAERVEGFAIGGDDYITKPASLDEVAARVHALCRRHERPRHTIVHVGDLEIDRPRRRVRRGEVPLSLTGREYALLEILVDAGGGVVSREDLLQHCWDSDLDPTSNSVNMSVSSLRRKLGNPPLIRTVRGSGYALDVDDVP